MNCAGEFARVGRQWKHRGQRLAVELVTLVVVPLKSWLRLRQEGVESLAEKKEWVPKCTACLPISSRRRVLTGGCFPPWRADLPVRQIEGIRSASHVLLVPLQGPNHRFLRFPLGLDCVASARRQAKSAFGAGKMVRRLRLSLGTLSFRRLRRHECVSTRPGCRALAADLACLECVR